MIVNGIEYVKTKARYAAVGTFSDEGIPGYHYVPVVDGKVIEDAVEALAGSDGFVTVFARDSYGNHIIKDGSLVTEKIRCCVELWRDVGATP